MSQRSPFNQRNMPKSAAAGEEETKTSATGMARRSPSKAKPVHDAGTSVRVVKKHKNADGTVTTTGLTKEEKKAQQKAEREEEDFFASLTDAMLKRDPLYNKRRHMWWVFLGLGLVCVVLSFAFGYLGATDGSNMYRLDTMGGILSVVALVLAYVFIITSLVFEFMKIRPMRKEVTAQLQGMSDKKRRALMDEIYEERAAKRAAKEASKK